MDIMCLYYPNPVMNPSIARPGLLIIPSLASLCLPTMRPSVLCHQERDEKGRWLLNEDQLDNPTISLLYCRGGSGLVVGMGPWWSLSSGYCCPTRKRLGRDLSR